MAKNPQNNARYCIESIPLTHDVIPDIREGWVSVQIDQQTKHIDQIHEREKE